MICIPTILCGRRPINLGSFTRIVLERCGEYQPLANSYKKSKDEPEHSYPLKINRCPECFHVQLSCTVNPDLIYKNYLYVSGTTKTYVEYMDWYAEFVMEKYCAQVGVELGPYSVLDIGCNDGSQLNAFKKLLFMLFSTTIKFNISCGLYILFFHFWNSLKYDKINFIQSHIIFINKKIFLI